MRATKKDMRIAAACVALFLLFCAVSSAFAGDSLVYTSAAATAKDNSLRNLNAGNYGGSVSFQLGGNYKWFLVQFDTLNTGVPAGATIDSAFITYVYNSSSGSFTLYTAQVLTTWGEGTGSGGAASSGQSNYYCSRYDTVWTTAPCAGIGTDRTGYLDSMTVNGDNPLKVNITQTVKSIKSSGINYGIIHIAPTTNYWIGYTSDNLTPSNRWVLRVYYTAAASGASPVFVQTPNGIIKVR